MTDLSIWTGIGRLTRDSEIKYTSSGQAILKFSIASSSSVKRGEQWVEEPTYREVVLFGKRAESLAQYLVKGKQVGVSGPEREERWEHEGKQYHKLSIAATDVELLGGKSDNAQSQGQSQPGKQGPAAQAPSGAAADDFSDDIPF